MSHASQDPETSVRIAISGGGLAGATLLHALSKHSHLDVHIFESAPAFKERGAAVGISRNALSALDLIGPTATACLKRAGAVPQKGVRFMLAQGENAGEMIDEIDAKTQNERIVSIVHRAEFLKALLADVPLERMHASKKLDKVDYDQAKGGPVTIHFTDGTTHECDILIGADGIHSLIRPIVLGANDPAVNPQNTGWRAMMALKPCAIAQAKLGTQLVDSENPRQYGWTGDGNWMMHDVLSDGQLVQFTVCSMDENARGSDLWRTTVSADDIRREFQQWPANLKGAIEELLCDQPEQPAIYLWDQPPGRTYFSGPICIIGDAAHATTPWQGSGAGMSIEDSLVLSTLLGRAQTVAHAVVALEVYDTVRRDRTQKVVESSRETGIIMTGKGSKTGLKLENLKEELPHRWDFIINFDNKKHCEDAIKLMESLLDSI